MKYEHVRTWFNLKVGGKKCTVRPYNAETTRKHQQQLGWSAGFTHYEIRETGTTGFCGVEFFEQNARPLTTPRRRPMTLMKPLTFKKAG